MSPSCRAVIDIGTNSVKLLVGKVEGRRVHPLLEEGYQTRLGRGLYETRRLRPDAVARTAEVVGGFVERARDFQPASVRIIATSAVRDAENRDSLLDSVRETAGIEVEVLTGEQEAIWVFLGVTTDPTLTSERLLVVDVGGGSTELILGERGEAHHHHSYPLGSVRLWEMFPPSDPPTPKELERVREWLQRFLAESVAPALKSEADRFPSPRAVRLVGTGGTLMTLARIHKHQETFDRDRIEGTELTRNEMEGLVNRLWEQPLVSRQSIVGLPPERADIILTGAAIYEAVLHHFGLASVRVSTRGLRYAALITPPPPS